MLSEIDCAVFGRFRVDVFENSLYLHMFQRILRAIDSNRNIHTATAVVCNVYERKREKTDLEKLWIHSLIHLFHERDSYRLL